MFKHVSKWDWVVLIFGIMSALMMLFVPEESDAYWDDQATENANAVFSGAGQNGNSILAFSGIQPIPSGWVGLYAARQTADKEVVSEVLAAHIQGGFTVYDDIKIEAYVTGKRDKLQEIALLLETGYFIRPGAWTWNSVTFSGGAGNYTARRDDDEAIGRDAADASTTFGWLMFLTGRLQTQFGEASTTARYKPSWNFKDNRIELLGALNKEISDTWAFGISVLTEIDNEVHSSYLANFTFTPES